MNSLLPVEQSCLRETGNLGSRTTAKKHCSIHQKVIAEIKFSVFSLFLCLVAGWHRSSGLSSFTPHKHLYLLKSYQPSAEGINFNCYAGRQGKMCAWLCVHALYIHVRFQVWMCFLSQPVWFRIMSQWQPTGVYTRWLQAHLFPVLYNILVQRPHSSADFLRASKNSKSFQ